MQFFLGLLTAVVFFVLLLGAVYIGYRLGQRKKKPPNIDDEDKRRAKELHSDFMKLMNYSEDIALQRKRVTDE
ncbi:hypothetical protein ACFYKX_26535 [Cytobacillus sp. FJAT-54145]|uniref:Uncharacterized protein n=1 Tax=Cytobacillus spartinae TaxID=3299023 RepID=A0ABW6KIP4_9BACI